MDVKSTERQQETRCTLEKWLLFGLAATDTQICSSVSPLRQRLATSLAKSIWDTVAWNIRSIRPSPRSRANHWLTINFQDWLDCTSRMKISSKNHEGLSPKLLWPIFTSRITPRDLLTYSTNMAELPREKNTSIEPVSSWLSWRMPLLPSEP